MKSARRHLVGQKAGGNDGVFQGIHYGHVKLLPYRHAQLLLFTFISYNFRYFELRLCGFN